jgi:diguanylate cyclase (GGDEF)-like protein/PAS domain S-box-containing protein
MMARGERPSDVLDDAARQAALTSLLRDFPGATVCALDEFGGVASLPSALELNGQQVADVGSPFELVESGSRTRLISAWVRARAVGRASEHVVLTDGTPGVCHIVDVRHCHGVVVGVIAGDGAVGPVCAVPAPAVMPRTGRVHKDELGRILVADDDIAQILGVEASDLVGMRAMELIDPQDHERSVAAWIELLSSPGGTVRLRARHRRSDGSWLWMELTNVNRLEHAEACVVTEMADITTEMEALEALRSSEQLLRRLAEALPLGVLHVDRGRRVMYANERINQIVGASDATTFAGRLASVVPSDRAVLGAALDRVLSDGADIDLEVQIRLDTSAKAHLCAVTIRALTDAADRPDGAVLCLADVTEAAELRAALQRRATIDELTGCLNRGTAFGELERMVQSHGIDSPGTAVVFVDLDGFKTVNDTHGHEAGDRLLMSVVNRLKGICRSGDVIGRLGGDEFIVALSCVDSLGDADVIGRRVQAVLGEPLEMVGGRPMRILASVGVAWSAATNISARSLTAAADGAMYRSKRAGTSQPIVVLA